MNKAIERAKVLSEFVSGFLATHQNTHDADKLKASLKQVGDSCATFVAVSGKEEDDAPTIARYADGA